MKKFGELLLKYKWLIVEIFTVVGIYYYIQYVYTAYAMPTGFSDVLLRCFISIVLACYIFLGRWLNKPFVYIVLVLFTLYFVAQGIYYRGFQQYFRFATAYSLMSEVAGEANSVKELIYFEDWLPFIYLSIGLVVSLLATFIKHNRINHWIIHFCLRVFCAVALLFPITDLFADYNQMIADTQGDTDFFVISKSDYYIYNTIPNTTSFVNTFGLGTLFYRDGLSFVMNDVLSDDVSVQITNYLSNKKAPEKNEMTGIFEGKSLLFIQAESLMNIAIDEQLTPTLYKMFKEGISVTNFNTPLLVGSTSDTEFMTNTSLIPVTDGYAVSYLYINNTYPTTLAKIFKANGYSAVGFHNNYAEYYNRDVMFPEAYGYDFFDCIGLGLEEAQPDSDVLNVAKWILLESEKSLGYFITYNGHQPYDLASLNEKEAQYVDLIKEVYPELSEEYVSYFAKNMDLDRALEQYLVDAEFAGRLDDLVIIIMGDHYAKGLVSSEQKQDVAEQMELEYSERLFYTPCIIYNRNTEKVDIYKAGTALDMVPTIMNLWNMEYDYTSTLGDDIFDSCYDGFYFGNAGEYRSNKFKYNYLDDEYTVYDDYTVEQAEEDVNHYLIKQEVSKGILQLDYFADKERKMKDEGEDKDISK